MWASLQLVVYLTTCSGAAIIYEQGHSQAWAWGNIAPSNKNIAPSNKMKPISPLGLDKCFLLDFFKKRAHCRRKFVFASKNVGSKFSRNKLPQTKNPGYFPDSRSTYCWMIVGTFNFASFQTIFKNSSNIQEAISESQIGYNIVLSPVFF